MLKEDNFYDAVSQVGKLLEEPAIATEHNFNSYNLFARFCVVIIICKKKIQISSLHTHLLGTATNITPLPSYGISITLYSKLNHSQFLFAHVFLASVTWTCMIPFLPFPGCLNDKLKYNINMF